MFSSVISPETFAVVIINVGILENYAKRAQKSSIRFLTELQKTSNLYLSTYSERSKRAHFCKISISNTPKMIAHQVVADATSRFTRQKSRQRIRIRAYRYATAARAYGTRLCTHSHGRLATNFWIFFGRICLGSELDRGYGLQNNAANFQRADSSLLAKNLTADRQT